jgi:lactoylglutathione lyase/methylmalonyl-CoA/ethylmalonyl-CoA epimerase
MVCAPIGKLDHVGIAVRSISEARKFFEGLLGARFLFAADSPERELRFCVLDLNGLMIELLEPVSESSQLRQFLDKRGEGVHHLTLNAPDAKRQVERLKGEGVRVVEEREWSPTSYEAFISPRSAHGVLIQLGSGYPTLDNTPEWTKTGKKD